jgi:glycosyltransferase involved in cell wall biosynthesis
MKIGIYIEVLKSSEKTGIGRYIEGLIKSLSEIDSKNEYLLYYQVPLFSKPLEMNLTKGFNFKLRPVTFPTVWFDERPRLWWDYYLPFITNKDKLDVFHGPNHFIPSKGKCKKIVTIHDIAYFFMDVHGRGMDRILEQWTRKSFAAADKIITVSNSTANDCIKEGADTNKVKTIYQGFESSFEHMKLSDEEKQEQVLKMELPDKCILFLGSLQPRKNLSQLLDAFSLIVSEIPHSLVLAGGQGSSYTDLCMHVERLSLQERVIFTGYIDDKQRAALYQHSELFVYPSKYEGFGLVVLEAMSFGLPVISTNISSLPEAVGDAGILVEVDDVNALAKKMLEIINSNELRNKLIKSGYKHIQSFGWEKSALEMLNLYTDLYSGSFSDHKNA